MKPIELATDKTSVRLQIAHYNNATQDGSKEGEATFNLDGSSTADTSSNFVGNRAVEITSTTALTWVRIGVGVTAATGVGQPIPANTWKHMTVNAGERVSVFGGEITVVPLGG